MKKFNPYIFSSAFCRQILRIFSFFVLRFLWIAIACRGHAQHIVLDYGCRSDGLCRVLCYPYVRKMLSIEVDFYCPAFHFYSSVRKMLSIEVDFCCPAFHCYSFVRKMLIEVDFYFLAFPSSSFSSFYPFLCPPVFPVS